MTDPGSARSSTAPRRRRPSRSASTYLVPDHPGVQREPHLAGPAVAVTADDLGRPHARSAHCRVGREVRDHRHDVRPGRGDGDARLSSCRPCSERTATRLQHIGRSGGAEVADVDALGAADPDPAGQRLVHVAEQRVAGLGPPDRVQQRRRCPAPSAPGDRVVQQLGHGRRDVGAQHVDRPDRRHLGRVVVLVRSRSASGRASAARRRRTRTSSRPARPAPRRAPDDRAAGARPTCGGGRRCRR